MKRMTVLLDNVSAIRRAVTEVGRLDVPVYMESPDGNYRVNAASLLGVVSMDLTQPVIVTCAEKDYDKVFGIFRYWLAEPEKERDYER